MVPGTARKAGRQAQECLDPRGADAAAARTPPTAAAIASHASLPDRRHTQTGLKCLTREHVHIGSQSKRVNKSAAAQEQAQARKRVGSGAAGVKPRREAI